MRKLTLFLVLVALMAVSLNAEFKANGNFRTRMGYYKMALGEEIPSNSKIDSRLRMKFQGWNDENIKLVWQVEVGDVIWGKAGAQTSTDGKNVETKHAYLNYVCPKTEMDVTIGLQYFADHRGLVFDDDFAAIVLEKDFDGLKGQFIIAKTEEGLENEDDDVDIFALNFYKGNFGMHNIFERMCAGSTYNMWFMPYYKWTNDALCIDGTFAYQMGSQKINMMESREDDEDMSIGAMALALKVNYISTVKFGLDFLYATGQADDEEDITAFSGISPWYVNGLEIFGHGINDGVECNVPRNGQMDIVLTAAYPFNDEMTLKGAFGMISNIEGDETAVGTEIDLGFQCKIMEKLTFDGVFGMGMPGKALGEDLDNIMEVSGAFNYGF